MFTQKRHLLLILPALLTMLWLMSSCAMPGSGAPGGNSLTPLQVLQNSANTMNQLKSSHIEMQSSTGIQKAQGNSTPTNKTFTLKGSGDAAAPDQEQMKLTLDNGTVLTAIAQGNQVYVQNPEGTWYVFNKGDLTNLIGNPFSGVTINQNSLLLLMQHSQITDHGDELLNGQNLRHITATLDKTGLSQLIQQNPQLISSLNNENININDYLNRAKSFQSSLDVWIDESKFYLHRAQMQLNLTANTTGVDEGQTPSTTTIKLNTVVDLSKFNVPVTITPPVNAIPTNNPAVILGK
ncbi:MAG TPA: hypothetical protein VH593_27470 [Ktedonobacteraceae bacterium]|jgi:hypothetical protein